MTRTRLLTPFAGLCLVFAGFSSGCDNPPAACTVGVPVACTCPDGTAGAAPCNADGTIGVCVCVGIDAGMMDGGNGVDAGPIVGDDAGNPDTDAGPQVDSGIPVDAGPQVDSGVPGDAGPDSGIPVDAGPPGADAGPPGTDAGPPGTDAGPPGTDAGPPGTDAGPPGVDAGPPGTDAGPPGVDAGPPPVGCGDGFCDGFSGGAEDQTTCPQDCVCEPYGPNTCAGTGWCLAFARDPDYTQVGACQVPGPAPAGGACGAGNLCEADNLCVGTCETQCNWMSYVAGDSSCPSGEGCAPLFDAMGALLQAGVCIDTCTPWGTGTAAGCAAGEWCRPSLETPDVGFCTTDGAGTDGDTCAAFADCASQHICTPDTTGGPLFCRPMCRASDNLGCAVGETCIGRRFVEPVTGDAFEGQWGTTARCVEVCDFDNNPTCTNPAETCVVDELLLGDSDVCVDIGTPLPEGSSCGGQTGLCAGAGVCSGDVCTYVCRASEGSIPSTPHPDCAGGGTCNAVGAPEFGFCN